MHILCACERSQALASEFLKKGFDAWSCDLADCEGSFPHRHIVGDVFEVVEREKPEYIFAFPPCTHLTYANGARLVDKLSDGRSASALDFIKRMFALPRLVMLENPLGIIPKYLGVPYSQIVSPDDFGSPYKKRTCLWLRGLPLLLPTTCRAGKSWILSCSSSSRREILDSHLAVAMVSQWSFYLSGHLCA